MPRPRCRRLLLGASLLRTARAFPMPSRIRLRPGFPDDVGPISLALAKELMNPLGISHKNNLLVAEDTLTGQRVGWAQIRSLGYAGIAATDPSRFDDDDAAGASSGGALSRREVQSTSSIEDDVNERLWQEFEDGPVGFPNGLASLPWTAEYRAASKAADDRLRRRERMLERELASRPRLWEATVYVKPEWRGQGIGTALVSNMLERHATKQLPGRDVYAFAREGSKTLPFYERLGFEREAAVPNAMAMEMSVGGVLTKALGEEPVCLRASI
ncbi:hypothetical protein ACHAXT_004930 [Thalassiosira profunda]